MGILSKERGLRGQSWGEGRGGSIEVEGPERTVVGGMLWGMSRLFLSFVCGINICRLCLSFNLKFVYGVSMCRFYQSFFV